jgi:hypothetical protein
VELFGPGGVGPMLLYEDSLSLGGMSLGGGFDSSSAGGGSAALLGSIGAAASAQQQTKQQRKAASAAFDTASLKSQDDTASLSSMKGLH